jgi:hypothetical protein
LTHEQGGIRLSYHPSARDRARVLIDDAEAVRAELGELLGQPVLASVEVRVARGSSDFARIVPAAAPQETGVLALSELGVLVVSLRATPSSASDVRATFRRGMAHLALDEVAGSADEAGLPRWFRIGFALEFSGHDALTRARALWWASMQRELVPLVDLDHHLADGERHGSVSSAEAADFVRFLLDDDRREEFPRLLLAVHRGVPFERAVGQVYQRDLAAVEQAWREDVAKHKAFLPILVAGSTAWLGIALLVRMRRRARQRRDEKQRDAPKLKLVPLKQGKRRDKLRIPQQQIPEPDVPKVSHNGRWHTLH